MEWCNSSGSKDIESGKKRKNSNDLIEMISITPKHPLNPAREME